MGDPSTPASGGGWTPPSIEHLQTLLPQYEISRLLGHGGMGAVYEGLQSNLDRKVAIKILPETLSEEAEDLNFTERFKLEAKSMARMNHPGIISVYDFGQTSEHQLYYVMEFIDGMDIHQYLKHHGGRLPQESAIAIVAHVLDALGYAHERGIVHRDIKPANIMIKSDGRVKVADFGLVKRLSESGEGSPDSAAITMSNVAIGTPDFVAPESLEIGRVVDHRADLYSIGVMFYQLLTGSVPRGNFRPPSGRIEGLDPRLDKIVSRAMEAEPDDRYPSAEDFRDAIDEILASPVPEDHFTGPVKPEKQPSGAVIPGGKRLHLTSVQKKTPSSSSVSGESAGSGNTPVPAEPIAEPKKKNPVLIAAIFAIFAIGLVVIGGGYAFMAGGGSGGGDSKSKVAKVSGKGEKKSKPPKTSSKSSPSPPVSKPDRPKPRPTPTPASPTPSPKSVEKNEPKGEPEPKVAKKTTPKPSDSTRKPKEVRPVKVEPAPAAAAPVAMVPTDPSPQPEVAPIPVAEDPVTKRLAEIDEKYRNVFEKPYQDALANLNTQFVGALGREATAATQTGDLDLVLAFQNEIKQIGSTKAAGPADAADAPPKLTELRKTWHTQAAQLEAVRLENQKKADIARDQAFDLFQQELVKAQDIEAAQRVKALREGLTGASAARVVGAGPGEPEWISLFDGESLEGWKSSGNEKAFSIVGGTIRARNTRGLLYFEGLDSQSGVFKNFEFRAKVRTEEAFNSGVFFHLAIKEDDLEGGYEVQIANENSDPRKTGSLWNVADVSEMLVSDGDWFEIGIRVEGKEITISIDDEVVTRWTEPEDWVPEKPGQRLGQGHFGLQSNPGGQDDGGEVRFKDIRVRRLSE